ncbi:alpha/beta hydrolase [Rhodoferax sp.]|uniref:alpha/beta hydrolase n=1 Tax=Rhodoferax sp. TaxID=50421 RepID=UPI002841266E|nr:alpha/beta hydrolase [Rhodoferax sp.]MDR3370253.1 alpha/beta hydrolase [Rhodoferax sp.]
MKPSSFKLLLIGILLLCGLSEASQAGPLFDRWRARRAEQATAATEHALPNGVRRLSNIAYGSDPAQTFDVYLPPNAHDAPVIFMVHGGAWAIGNKAMGRVVDAKVARWVGRGFIFVSTNYRMLPSAAPDLQLRDVASALAAAQERVPQWGGDARRFVLMGHSAGAHLVSLLNATPHLDAAQPWQPVLGVVALDSAAMNVEQIMRAKHYRLYDKPFGKDPAYWRAMSPTLQLQAGAKPLLEVCSTRRDDSCQQAHQFAERATQLGVRAEVLEEDMSHGDINSQLGDALAYTAAVEKFMAELDPALAALLR